VNVTFNVLDGIGVVRIEGSIDGKTAPVAREKIQPAIESKLNVLLDMTAVNYLSSAGLRFLLLVHREIGTQGNKVVLVGVSDDIAQVMSHTGFLPFFTLVPSEAEAFPALQP
jgi:anti-sigma B factor antagonist